MTFEVRPCGDVSEFSSAVLSIGQYFGNEPDLEGSERFTRMLFGNRAYNLPSRVLDELPEHGVVRERLSPARWDYGRKTPVEHAPRDHPALSTGDSVRHQTMGEGVVTGIDAGGVITVRFEDGSERRLMLDYAPLEKIPG